MTCFSDFLWRRKYLCVGKVLLELDKSDLKELGVTRLGQRAILLQEIEKLQKNGSVWAASPIQINVEDVDVEIKTGNFHYLKQSQYASNFEQRRTVPLYIREEAMQPESSVTPDVEVYK